MKHHLKEVNMGYVEHFKFAMGFSMNSFIMSMILIVHAIIPCLFQKKFSIWIKKCNDRLR